ncbi:MAG: family 43 glycosylhydrolase [Clostridia bacterium]|nr:family 43 glycosylhydrolase [Clostridia bacterium]
MKLSEINIRDPFILPYEGKYYMYGTRAKATWESDLDGYGFDVYVSCDLENWSEPISIFEKNDGFFGKFNFWAPEVHYYKGKFYLFATFNDGNKKGTAILICDTPDGIFKEHSLGAITPSEWECLDGTLYVENETPYMIFCHEWTEIKDGEVCAVELSSDLKTAVGEPFTLFKASTPSWAFDIRDGEGCYVTDGPFLLNLESELICIWSSFSKGEYVEAIARSDNGKIDGNWTIDEKLLFEKDGGHGMIFKDFENNLNFVYHTPNDTPNERPAIKKISKFDLLK